METLAATKPSAQALKLKDRPASNARDAKAESGAPGASEKKRKAGEGLEERDSKSRKVSSLKIFILL